MTTPITGQGLNVCIPPDDELSSTSKKAAQNKVITEEFTELSNAQSMIATVEATTTASKNYAVGDLLVYDGKLYEVTSAIATGATITVGTNVTQTTVETQIASADGGGGETWYTAELSAADWDSTNHMFLFDAGTGNKFKKVELFGQIVNDGTQTATETVYIGFGTDQGSFNYSCPCKYANLATTARSIGFAAQMEMHEFPLADQNLVRCATSNYFRAGFSDRYAHTMNVDILMEAGDARATNHYWKYNNPRYIKICCPNWNIEWAAIRIMYTLQ